MNNGWEVKKLATVSAINYGYTESASSEPVGPRFLRITDIQDDRVDWESVPYCKIESANLPKYRLASGDIVFARTGATTGKSFLVDAPPDAVFASYLIRLRLLDKQLLPEFVSLFFQTADYWQLIKDGSSGSAQGGFNATKLGALSIPVPSLPEQQRIVGILDEAFAGIATAKANAERNLQNARALFEGHLQSIFSQRGEGWVDKPIDELIESNVIGLTKSSRDQGEGKAWPYVKMNNITHDNRFDFSSFTCVDATDQEVSKFSLRDGDFLFNTRNSYELVGKSCLYESDSDGVVLFNNNIMRVRFKKGVDARFILLAFSSKSVADKLNALKSGTTNVSAIYFKDLKSLVIPRPSTAAQETIAAKLESLVAETQRLASLYERKLAALEALKKSLLHQAFSGNL